MHTDLYATATSVTRDLPKGRYRHLGRALLATGALTDNGVETIAQCGATRSKGGSGKGYKRIIWPTVFWYVVIGSTLKPTVTYGKKPWRNRTPWRHAIVWGHLTQR